jgi:methyl-accepting chemotaxis protein
LLLTKDKEMAADVRKFADAAAGTPFAQRANDLETKVQLVQVANWRMLANRDCESVATFRVGVTKAWQAIVGLVVAAPPEDLTKLYSAVRDSLAEYSTAFEETGPNLLRADRLYYDDVVPATKHIIDALDQVRTRTDQAFEANTAETEHRISTTITMQEAVAAAAVIAGLLIAFLIGRGIIGPLSGPTAGIKELAAGNFAVVLPGPDRAARPLQAMAEAMKRIAGGELDAVVPGFSRRDAIGEMADAVEIFKSNAHASKAQDVEQRQAEARAISRRKADMQMADDFEGAVGKIVETVSTASARLETSATTLSSTAEHAQISTTAVAAASEQASTNVRTVALATEEMTLSINEISCRVKNPPGSPSRLSNRRVGPTVASANCPRPQAASATSSN